LKKAYQLAFLLIVDNKTPEVEKKGSVFGDVILKFSGDFFFKSYGIEMKSVQFF